MHPRQTFKVRLFPFVLRGKDYAQLARKVPRVLQRRVKVLQAIGDMVYLI